MKAGIAFLLFSLIVFSAPAKADPVGHVSMGNLRSALTNYNAAVTSETIARRATVTRNNKAIDTGISRISKGVKAMDTIRNFGETFFDPLVPDDMEFDPDFNPPGAPSIPVHCEVEGGPACQACYQGAYNKLNFVRHYLEVLRGIYGATEKYTKSAIAFGDSMAGLHGGFGMAWPPERKGIQDAFKNMGNTYDEKYRAYMEELLEGLQEVASCEAMFFGEEDWYNRFGFIYYTYMQDRYRRGK